MKRPENSIMLDGIVESSAGRYTKDQTPVLELLLRFEQGYGDRTTHETVKVVQFGRDVLNEPPVEGDRVLVEGSCRMETIAHESYKEKIMEIRAHKIECLGGAIEGAIASTVVPDSPANESEYDEIPF